MGIIVRSTKLTAFFLNALRKKVGKTQKIVVRNNIAPVRAHATLYSLFKYNRIPNQINLLYARNTTTNLGCYFPENVLLYSHGTTKGII